MLHDGLVPYKSQGVFRVYVPAAARTPILGLFHDSLTAGHPGVKKTLKAIRRKIH